LFARTSDAPPTSHPFPTRRSSDLDSGADKDHPELKDVIAREFDAVGGTFEPHAHGTGMAGAIAGQDTLKSAAPNARILNVRAFADRKSTRLNSSHVKISYAVFCLK